MTQAIALIDGNNFYAACEKSFNPSLANLPVVILSNNDGCIISRSSEARKLGISMGQPYFKVRDKLKELGVVVRSSNYALYGDISHRLMSLLSKHCKQLEVYSIDEAFAEISLYHNTDFYPWARQLRALTYQSLGIPISIGIGNSKVQAKIANHLAKETSTYAGVFDLRTAEDQDKWLGTVEIENIWGVGRRLSKWFREKGITTALLLRNMPSIELHAKCGVVGIRLQEELKGNSCIKLKVGISPKKETCVSRSFSRPVTNLEELKQAISTHIISASQKLRRQSQRAGAITVFANTSPFQQPFYKNKATTQLDIPSNDTAVLLSESVPLINQIFQPGHLLTKAGVVMHKLQPSKYLQTTLLKQEAVEQLKRREHLMLTIDTLNIRYGRGTISWAACLSKPGWEMRREQLSFATTTKLKEVSTVYS